MPYTPKSPDVARDQRFDHTYEHTIYMHLIICFVYLNHTFISNEDVDLESNSKKVYEFLAKLMHVEVIENTDNFFKSH